MKSPIIIAIGLAIVGLYACEGSPSPLPAYKHFITGYQNAVFMYVGIYMQPGHGNEISFRDLSIYIRPYKTLDEYDYSDRVSEEQAEKLAIQFNDTNYNGQSPIGPTLYRQTVSLDIISDADYDAAHPAGTLLNDIVNIYYLCADNILNPPYNFEPTQEQKSLGLTGPYFLEPLRVFNEKKPTLILFSLYLTPIHPPTTTSTHRFTVTYKNIDGVELSATTEPVTILQ